VERHIWHEKDLPPRVRIKLGLPSPDLGVDLVAESLDGSYWAIQCKYHHDPSRNLRKGELDSFLDITTRVCRGKFSTLLVVSYARSYSVNLQKLALEFQYCLGDRFESLDADFFRQARALIRKHTPKIKKRIPRSHQRTAIKNAVKHFIVDGNDRECSTAHALF